MPPTRALSTTICALLLAIAPPAVASDLQAVAFISGSWGADGQVVEHWLPPLRGLMVGVNRDPQGDSTPFFEFLRIEERDDGVFYVASPKGAPPTDFELVESSANHAVFANPEHDFPQKIVYIRSGDDLRVEVGADRDGEWSGFTLDWSSVPCDAARSGSDGDQTR